MLFMMQVQIFVKVSIGPGSIWYHSRDCRGWAAIVAAAVAREYGKTILLMVGSSTLEIS